MALPTAKAVQTTSKTKTVSFRRTVNVRRTRNVDDLSEREVRRRWYNRKDFERMRNQTKELSKRLSGHYQADVLGSRGLEPPAVRDQRNETIKNGQLVVLMEQEQQWDGGRGVVHPLTLARISSAYTKRSVEKAIRRAAIIRQQVRDQERKAETAVNRWKPIVPSRIQRSVSDTFEPPTRKKIEADSSSAEEVRRECRRCSSDTTKLIQTTNANATLLLEQHESLQRRSPQQTMPRSTVVSSFHRWRQLSVVPPRL